MNDKAVIFFEITAFSLSKKSTQKGGLFLINMV